MLFSSWLRNLKAAFALGWTASRRTRPTGRRPAPGSRLNLESLEDRFVLSTFLVTTTQDSGLGSLRDAIARVDADPHPRIDVIKFAIGSGPQTISPLSALPAITHAVVVDGTSQPGYAGAPLIELDGTNAGDLANGLMVDAGHSTVKGLVINRFGNAGILLEMGGGDTIAGNYLGTDRTGTLAVANSNAGVEIANGGSNVIGGTEPHAGNLISGNFDGVLIDSGDGNRVEGNFIGTDVTGTLAVTNEDAGINIGGVSGISSNNVIGGTTPHARNLISGNGTGVVVATSNNRVEGNFIGTDVSGTLAVGNADGVDIGTGSNNTIGGTTRAARNIISGNFNSGITESGFGDGDRVEGNYIGTDVLGSLALPNFFGVDVVGSQFTIGGTKPGAGNVISGNKSTGVVIEQFGSSNVVQGNYIGTDARGTAALGNGNVYGGDGVDVEGSNNLIGGTSAAARNVISGNYSNGLAILNGGSGNQVQGNFIGTDKTGRKPLGNMGAGVAITQGAPSQNWIGGAADGAGNIIAFNGGAGVTIFPWPFQNPSDTSGVENAILGNSIFGNLGGGIVLGPGANNNQAPPVLTSAVSSHAEITIQGTLTSMPNTTYTLEFFSNPAGTSQGKTFLGRITVTTDATGKATFTATFDVEIDPGQVITATATDPLNDTSQFSNGGVVT
jgi:hypothetical protein